MHTLDPHRPHATGLWVRDDRIVAVGDADEVIGAAGPTVDVVDLGGATVVPGLIDPHCHVSMLAYLLGGADCSQPGAGDIAALQGRLEATPRGADGWVTLTFEVRLSAPADRVVAVRFATVNGTARAGSDYHRAAGMVRFRPGETVKTATVRVRGDRLSGDGEFFRLKLGRPSGGAVLGDAEGIGSLVRRHVV